MKNFSSKILLFVLSLFVLFGIASINPSHQVNAQALCNEGNNWCVEQICGTSPTDPGLISVIGMDYETCVYLVPGLGRTFFAPPEEPDPWYNQGFRQFGLKVFDPSNPDEIFGERYTYAQVTWIFNSVIHMVCPFCHAQDTLELFTMISDAVNLVREIVNFTLGVSDPFTALKDTLPRYGFVGNSYLFMAMVPDMIFTDKISSGVDELKYVASKFNIASPAYAQGVGYEKLGIGTIRGFWLATRNMAFLIAVIILIVAGFMIIFRTKISAQASVTIQMVIPRLVVSIILVAFSYAIVGFVIDMIYVVIAAVLGLLRFTEQVTGISIFDGGDTGLQLAITRLTGDFNFVGHFLGVYIAIAIILILLSIIVPIVLALPTGGIAYWIWAAAVPLVGFIMGFFMWSVYVWARVLGQMIIAYLSLILLTIAGPIMIIMDILPTSTGGFKKWIMCVISNASVFVSYALISIFAFLFFDNTTGGFLGLDQTGFMNDPTSTHIRTYFDLPLLPGNGYPRGLILQYLIFVGFFSMAPNIVNSIKNSLCKSTDVSDFLEKTVKDTIGQVTSAGKSLGSGVTDYKKEQARQDDLKKKALEAK